MMMTTIPHYHIIAITIDSERVMVGKSINKIMLITISITFPSNSTTSPIYHVLHFFSYCPFCVHVFLNPEYYHHLNIVLIRNRSCLPCRSRICTTHYFFSLCKGAERVGNLRKAGYHHRIGFRLRQALLEIIRRTRTK